jgi:hypothetical protein
MRQCPNCLQRVPLRASLGGSIVCPACQTELQPKVWSIALSLLPAMLVSDWIADGLQTRSLGSGLHFIAFSVMFILLALLGWAILARFRLKS